MVQLIGHASLYLSGDVGDGQLADIPQAETRATNTTDVLSHERTERRAHESVVDESRIHLRTEANPDAISLNDRGAKVVRNHARPETI